MAKTTRHKRGAQNPKRISRFLARAFPQVKEVHDAHKSVVVEVDPRDCAAATKGEATDCAMARSAKRQFKADGVIIGMTASYIVKGNKAIRFKTPETVSREITSFDRHHDFEPGTYHLAPVPPSQREYTYRPKRESGSREEKRVVHHQTARVRTVREEAAPKKVRRARKAS